MKKAIKIFSLILCAMLMLVTPILGKQQTVYADTYGTLIEAGTDITDVRLYTLLNNFSRGTLGRGALRDKSLADVVVLDLRGDPDNDLKIKSLEGLNNLTLTSLKVLKLDYNNITSIDAKVFSHMSNLEALYISNCNVSALDLSSCEKLRYLDLSNNNITSIQLNKMVVNNEISYTYDADFHYDNVERQFVWDEETTSTTYVNLSNNNIESLDAIKLPEDKEGCVVDMYNNGLTESVQGIQHMTINLGLQGLTKNRITSEVVDDETVYYAAISSKMYYQPIGDDTISFVFERTYTENGVEHTETIVANDTEFDSATVFALGVGSYKFKVLKGGVEDYTSAITKYYKAIEFNAIPTKPNYVFVVNGVEYVDLVNIDKVTTIKFSADEGAEIYYKFGDTDKWTKGNSLTLTKGGDQTLYVKAVIGDYESKTQLMLLHGAASLHIPSILLVLLIIGLILGFGFGLLPLIRRYVIRA